jgi:hypothetical protein
VRRQNRQPREYQRVKDRMRLDGAALAYMHAKTGKAWFLVPSTGQEVSEAVAQKILKDGDVFPSNDGLPPGVTQCYRILKSEAAAAYSFPRCAVVPAFADGAVMPDNIVRHPHRDLMAEAKHERRVVDSPEAEKLKGAVFDAVITYSDFLEQQGLIFEFSADPDNFCPRLKASALVVARYYGGHYGTTDITLKDGACDRVSGNGVNPDPYGAGPPDIPGRPDRDDETAP